MTPEKRAEILAKVNAADALAADPVARLERWRRDQPFPVPIELHLLQTFVVVILDPGGDPSVTRSADTLDLAVDAALKAWEGGAK